MVTDFRAGADTAGYDLYWVEEDNYGVVPSGPPTLNTARVISDTLREDKGTQQSAEISSDRQVADVILTSRTVPGEIGFELSLDEPDQAAKHLLDLFEGGFWGTWGSDLGITGTINASATDDSFNDNLAAGTMFANVLPGQWVKVGGYVDPSNNGFFQVTSKPNNDKIIVGATLVTEAGTGNETVAGRNLRNGADGHSYVAERRQSDLTPELFEQFVGVMFNGLSLAFQTDSIVTGSFNVIGSQLLAPASATVGDGTPNAKSTNSPLNTVTQTGSIREAGATPSAIVRTIDLNAVNNLRAQRGISGGAASDGIGVGKFVVTGNLEAFLIDKSLLDKSRDHTVTSLDWRVTDADGRAAIFTLPSIYLGGGNLPAQGQNTDRLQTYPFEARKDPTYGFTLQCDYFNA